MSNSIKLLIISLLVLSSVGCRSRCGNCGPGWFGGPVSTTVPAPATYSVNGAANYGVQTARQQDYYTIPNNGQPTPANNIPNYQGQAPTLSPQQGWRQQANPNVSGTLNPTSFTVQSPNPNLPVTSGAQTYNSNYQSTTTDERRDASRIAVTDASQVRAPSRFFPTGNMNRLSQSPVATTAAAVPIPGNNGQFASYGQLQTQYASQPTPINGTFQTNGQVASVASNNPYGTGNYGAYAQNTPVTSTASSPTLLAESTARVAGAPNSNTQVGWRDSQVFSGSNLNR